jgi:hypothetical protein
LMQFSISIVQKRLRRINLLSHSSFKLLRISFSPHFFGALA